MAQQILQIDAFTNVAFKGNPAGVCILAAEPTYQWMQSVAAEMNLAETAFVLPIAEGYSLRWFTPTVEVDLCGHATIAASHALWSQGILSEDEKAVFHTLSGVLTARKDDEWIILDFPSRPAKVHPTPKFLMEGLGIPEQEVLRSDYNYLVVLNSEEEVVSLEPDFGTLCKVDGFGVIVTAPSKDSRYDFVSRFFVPKVGVPEDPATGSSHCTLAPFWAQRLGKNPLIGHQISSRGGVIRVNVLGDRVELGGQAITVLEGTLV